jgi:hypothetical protein
MKNFFTILGFLTAILLVGGYLHRSGLRLTQASAPGTTSPTEDRAPQFATQDDPVAEEVDIFDPDRHYRDTPRGFDEVTTSTPGASRSAAVSDKDLQRWIRRQGPVAVMEAVRQGVPAGISLAVSVRALQRGQIDLRSDFNRTIITPLAEFKTSRERSYFKYSANSDSWVRGLAKLGAYDSAELDAILRRYDLAAYDAEVYLALQNQQRQGASSPAARPATYAASVAAPREREATAPRRAADEEVADEKLRANMAYAMNRLVDKKLEEEGKSMTFKAQPAPAAEVKTQARRQAESIAVGQSQHFSDPAEFHNVLREVLALEAGYASWADYRAADTNGAKRAFLRRSDLMANGGKMVITRRR